jgi:hypothetical protein
MRCKEPPSYVFNKNSFKLRVFSWIKATKSFFLEYAKDLCIIVLRRVVEPYTRHASNELSRRSYSCDWTFLVDYFKLRYYTKVYNWTKSSAVTYEAGLLCCWPRDPAPSSEKSLEDVHIWRFSASGQYSVKSAYESFFLGSTQFGPYKRIWKT